MPGSNDPRETDFERANNELNEGLKSCRAVVDNYRARLAGDHGANGGLPEAANDSEAGEDSSRPPRG